MVPGALYASVTDVEKQSRIKRTPQDQYHSKHFYDNRKRSPGPAMCSYFTAAPDTTLLSRMSVFSVGRSFLTVLNKGDCSSFVAFLLQIAWYGAVQLTFVGYCTDTKM